MRSLDESQNEQQSGRNVKAVCLCAIDIHKCKLCLQQLLHSNGCRTLNQVKFLLYFLLLYVLGPSPAYLEGAWRAELGEPLSQTLRMGTESEAVYAWDIVWDADGVAYIARGGLWRWDGASTRKLETNGLETIMALSMRADGRIWVGGINAFGLYDPLTNQFASFTDHLPEQYRNFGEVWSLFAAENGVWIGTFNKLFFLGEDDFHVWEFEGKHRVVFSYLDESILAHEVGVGIWQIKNKDRVLVNNETEVNQKTILGFSEYSESLIIGISGNGIFYFSRENLSLKNKIYVDEIDGKAISSLHYGNELIFIGTLDQGLLIIDYDGSLISDFPRKSFIGSGLFIKLKKSSNQILYMLKSEGITVADYDSTIGFTGDLEFDSVYNLVRKDERNFISSYSGFFVSNQPEGRPFERLSRVISRTVQAVNDWVYYDQYDSIMRYGGGAVEEVLLADGEIMTFAVLGEDRIVVGHYSGLDVYEKREGEWERTVLEERLRLDGLGAGGGRLWGWTQSGELWYLEEVRDVVKFKQLERLFGRDLEGTQHRLALMDSGLVVVFPDGLAYWRVGGNWEWRDFPEERALAERMVWEETDGILTGWLLGRKAAHWVVEEVVSSPGGYFEARLLGFPYLDRIGGIRDFLVDGTEPREFAFAGTRGILLADERVIEQRGAPGAPLIYEAGGLFRINGVPEFSFGKESVAFRFSVPGMHFGMPLTYETRLKGRETEWTVPYEENYRELGQLFEGSYAFEVRARDPLGRVGPVTTVAFRVLPPWYRTVTAYGGYVVLMVCAFYLLVLLRERRSRQRQTSLEGLVRERTLELERANEFKNEFIANLSHEIRNPLNGVIGFIQQLKAGEPPPAQSIRALRGAANYLQTTVEEVLDFARLESGRLTIDESLFDLRTLLHGVVEIYRDQAEQKGIALTTDVQLEAGMGVYSDPRKLQQILGNLAGNAIKFTKEGHVHVGMLLRTLDDGTGLLRIWVADSGCGIPEADRERIFEKFYQVNGGKGLSGTGLGLTLVQRFVDLLGGALELQSEEGEGSTFFVSLPVKMAPLEQAEFAVRASVQFTGVRVLIVEDMEYNRILLQELLSNLGCVVDMAEDGLKGFAMAKKGIYQAIFLDWDLPGMNGLEIARGLRSGGSLRPGTRIIGMTAAATVELREACLEAGMNEFLGKPLAMERIGQMLHGLHAERGLIRGKGLLAEMPSETGWASVMDRWIGYYEEYSGELRDAMEGTEAELVRKAAHRLLGHLRMLEVDAVPDAVTALMLAAQSGNREEMDFAWHKLLPLLERMEGCFDACRSW